MSIQRTIWLVMLILSVNVVITAQDTDCPALVETVLETVGDLCVDLGRNQACYGNNQVMAEDFDTVPVVDFVDAGDIVPVSQIARLVTAPLDVDGDTWGIAILALQADLPDTLPGQNVIFVIFGDTELINEIAPTAEAQPPPILSATATGSVNVRSGPGTGFGIVGTLAAGDAISLTGRNEGGDWAQFNLDGSAAWVYVPLLTVEGNVSILQVVEADDTVTAAVVAPMQTFRLTSSIGSAACAEVPQDGLLVQTPTDTVVHFRVNGVEVEIGSTAFFQSDDEILRVTTLEGQVSVTSDGETQVVEPGYSVSVPIDAPPAEPEPYDYEDVSRVPVSLLPQAVSVPIVIPSTSSEWVDTGIALTAGQSYTISASGEISVCSICATNPDLPAFISDFVGPEGNTQMELCDGQQGDCPLMPAPLGALVGRIGESAVFLVGEGGTFIAEQTGTLQLIVNDLEFCIGTAVCNNGWEDGAGSFIAIVEVDEE